MPDGVIYVPCNNRRAVVCLSCAETYRADTYQLVKAGLASGKGVPDTVTQTLPSPLRSRPLMAPPPACGARRPRRPISRPVNLDAKRAALNHHDEQLV
ncbi:MAG: hypothetical protein QOJ30_1429 [Pseudonocardiales bacterium]|jgi:hypothetical protein|nr:hypothetical protein [Pseudonocardiales bacterium]